MNSINKPRPPGESAPEKTVPIIDRPQLLLPAPKEGVILEPTKNNTEAFDRFLEKDYRIPSSIFQFDLKTQKLVDKYKEKLSWYRGAFLVSRRTLFDKRQEVFIERFPAHILFLFTVPAIGFYLTNENNTLHDKGIKHRIAEHFPASSAIVRVPEKMDWTTGLGTSLLNKIDWSDPKITNFQNDSTFVVFSPNYFIKQQDTFLSFIETKKEVPITIIDAPLVTKEEESSTSKIIDLFPTSSKRNEFSMKQSPVAVSKKNFLQRVLTGNKKIKVVWTKPENRLSVTNTFALDLIKPTCLDPTNGTNIVKYPRRNILSKFKKLAKISRPIHKSHELSLLNSFQLDMFTRVVSRTNDGQTTFYPRTKVRLEKDLPYYYKTHMLSSRDYHALYMPKDIDKLNQKLHTGFNLKKPNKTTSQKIGSQYFWKGYYHALDIIPLKMESLTFPNKIRMLPDERIDDRLFLEINDQRKFVLDKKLLEQKIKRSQKSKVFDKSMDDLYDLIHKTKTFKESKTKDGLVEKKINAERKRLNVIRDLDLVQLDTNFNDDTIIEKQTLISYPNRERLQRGNKNSVYNDYLEDTKHPLATKTALRTEFQKKYKLTKSDKVTDLQYIPNHSTFHRQARKSSVLFGDGEKLNPNTVEQKTKLNFFPRFSNVAKERPIEAKTKIDLLTHSIQTELRKKLSARIACRQSSRYMVYNSLFGFKNLLGRQMNREFCSRDNYFRRVTFQEDYILKNQSTESLLNQGLKVRLLADSYTQDEFVHDVAVFDSTGNYPVNKWKNVLENTKQLGEKEKIQQYKKSKNAKKDDESSKKDSGDVKFKKVEKFEAYQKNKAQQRLVELKEKQNKDLSLSAVRNAKNSSLSTDPLDQLLDFKLQANKKSNEMSFHEPSTLQELDPLTVKPNPNKFNFGTQRQKFSGHLALNSHLVLPHTQKFYFSTIMKAFINQDCYDIYSQIYERLFIKNFNSIEPKFVLHGLLDEEKAAEFLNLEEPDPLQFSAYQKELSMQKDHIKDNEFEKDLMFYMTHEYPGSELVLYEQLPKARLNRKLKEAFLELETEKETRAEQPESEMDEFWDVFSDFIDKQMDYNETIAKQYFRKPNPFQKTNAVMKEAHLQTREQIRNGVLKGSSPYLERQLSGYLNPDASFQEKYHSLFGWRNVMARAKDLMHFKTNYSFGNPYRTLIEPFYNLKNETIQSPFFRFTSGQRLYNYQCYQRLMNLRNEKLLQFKQKQNATRISPFSYPLGLNAYGKSYSTFGIPLVVDFDDEQHYCSETYNQRQDRLDQKKLDKRTTTLLAKLKEQKENSMDGGSQINVESQTVKEENESDSEDEYTEYVRNKEGKYDLLLMKPSEDMDVTERIKRPYGIDDNTEGIRLKSKSENFAEFEIDQENGPQLVHQPFESNSPFIKYPYELEYKQLARSKSPTVVAQELITAKNLMNKVRHNAFMGLNSYSIEHHVLNPLTTVPSKWVAYPGEHSLLVPSTSKIMARVLKMDPPRYNNRPFATYRLNVKLFSPAYLSFLFFTFFMIRVVRRFRLDYGRSIVVSFINFLNTFNLSTFNDVLVVNEAITRCRTIGFNDIVGGARLLHLFYPLVLFSRIQVFTFGTLPLFPHTFLQKFASSSVGFIKRDENYELSVIEPEENEIELYYELLQMQELHVRQEQNNCLLVGPPGTGKTVLVKALAREGGLPVILPSKYNVKIQIENVDQSFDNPDEVLRIQQIFQLADANKPCILFLDEIDSVGQDRQDVLTDASGKRAVGQSLLSTPSPLVKNKAFGSWREGKTPSLQTLNFERATDDYQFVVNPVNALQRLNLQNEANYSSTLTTNFELPEDSKMSPQALATLTQLLCSLDNSNTKNVFVIAATNRPETLDPALIRPGRLNKIIYLDLPQKQKRVDLLKFYSRSRLSEEINWDYFGTQTVGLSPAHLKAAMNLSALNKAYQLVKTRQAKRRQKIKHSQTSIEYGIQSVMSPDTFSKGFIKRSSQHLNNLVTPRYFQSIHQSQLWQHVSCSLPAKPFHFPPTSRGEKFPTKTETQVWNSLPSSIKRTGFPSLEYQVERFILQPIQTDQALKVIDRSTKKRFNLSVEKRTQLRKTFYERHRKEWRKAYLFSDPQTIDYSILNNVTCEDHPFYHGFKQNKFLDEASAEILESFKDYVDSTFKVSMFASKLLLNSTYFTDNPLSFTTEYLYKKETKKQKAQLIRSKNQFVLFPSKAALYLKLLQKSPTLFIQPKKIEAGFNQIFTNSLALHRSVAYNANKAMMVHLLTDTYEQEHMYDIWNRFKYDLQPEKYQKAFIKAVKENFVTRKQFENYLLALSAGKVGEHLMLYYRDEVPKFDPLQPRSGRYTYDVSEIGYEELRQMTWLLNIMIEKNLFYNANVDLSKQVLASENKLRTDVNQTKSIVAIEANKERWKEFDQQNHQLMCLFDKSKIMQKLLSVAVPQKCTYWWEPDGLDLPSPGHLNGIAMWSSLFSSRRETQTQRLPVDLNYDTYRPNVLRTESLLDEPFDAKYLPASFVEAVTNQRQTWNQARLTDTERLSRALLLDTFTKSFYVLAEQRELSDYLSYYLLRSGKVSANKLKELCQTFLKPLEQQRQERLQAKAKITEEIAKLEPKQQTDQETNEKDQD